MTVSLLATEAEDTCLGDSVTSRLRRSPAGRLVAEAAREVLALLVGAEVV
jgi:hypothetical protein